MREGGLGGGTVGRGLLAEALDPLEVGEDRELPDEDLGGLSDRVLRVERSVGRDVQAELVVVGALTDTSGLDVVRDAADEARRSSRSGSRRSCSGPRLFSDGT